MCFSTRAVKADDSETEVFSSTVDSDGEQNVTILHHRATQTVENNIRDRYMDNVMVNLDIFWQLKSTFLDILKILKFSKKEDQLVQANRESNIQFPIPVSQHVISIKGIIAIVLTMAKRTDFVDRLAPVDGCQDHLREQAYLQSQFF